MSVVIEADISRSTTLASEGPEGNVENMSSERHMANENSPLEHPNEIAGFESQRQNTFEQENGGAGDMMVQEDRVESMVTSVKVKSELAESGSGSRRGARVESVVTSMKVQSESIDIDSETRRGSRGEGEVVSKTSRQTKESIEQDEISKAKSESSGLNIVTHILEEILDVVIKDEEFEENLEAEEKSQQEAELKKYSVTTIKSVDERESIAVSENLKAQLFQEQEAAALQRKQIFLDNVALYNTQIALRTQLKLKNAFLLKRMYEYYKRKNMEHLFKDVPLANLDMEGKYVRVLFRYDAAQKAAQEEELKTFRLINTLEEKKKTVESELEEEYSNLLLREREIAKGLLSAQSSSSLSEKTMETLIQRQIIKSKAVAEQRLSYFKLRDKTNADEHQLRSLKHLGENLTLMEYEQLKMQSQSCVEKLEERDGELHRLRSKATSAIQVLAEVREKTHTLEEDIEAGKVVLHDVNQQLTQTRERLSNEKRRRDMSRSDTVRLRQEAGLLSEPKLLQDYRESQEEKENLLQELLDLKNKFESQKQNIMSLRMASTQRQNSPEANYR